MSPNSQHFVHLSQHAGQSLSQLKATLTEGATDFPLMATNCLPHVVALRVKIESLAEVPGLITNTDPVVLDEDKTPIASSKYHQELLEVDHGHLVEDLAKYKKLMDHLAFRLFKV